MTSCASLVKNNKTRQGGAFHMHRRGGVVAKEAKEINKTKREKKRLGGPGPLVSPTYEPNNNNSHNGPFL
jgi:hypothetical protein